MKTRMVTTSVKMFHLRNLLLELTLQNNANLRASLTCNTMASRDLRRSGNLGVSCVKKCFTAERRPMIIINKSMVNASVISVANSATLPACSSVICILIKRTRSMFVTLVVRHLPLKVNGNNIDTSIKE